MLMRPVAESDLDDLHELAGLTQHGLTTLPKDRSTMQRRIKQSLRSFQDLEDADPQGQLYLFVMTDETSGRVVGTSGIVSKVGGFKPFYAYRVEHEHQTSKSLNHDIVHPVLHLVKEHDGPSEIGSLFLHPDYRGGGRGRLASLSRFLFMANHPLLFEDDVIAEMRGVIHEDGSSPFWDALGSHFFPLDLPNADMLSLTNKDFIEELMPKHPIYVDLLGREAQSTVAEVHPNTVPARKMLQSEGFRFRNLVDIFEAGPILHCQRGEIRAVKQSRVKPITEISESVATEKAFVVSTVEHSFRATLSSVVEKESGVTIPSYSARILNVSIGDSIRLVETRSQERETE